MAWIERAASGLPDALRAPALQLAENVCADFPAALAARLAQDAALAQQFARVIGLSRFVAETLRRFPDVLEDLLASGDIIQSYSDAAAMQRHMPSLESDDEAGLQRQLRLFRRREMVRIIWRDLNRTADMAETTRDISRLAEIALQQALAICTQQMQTKYGTPTSHDGQREVGMVVLGMGKLGAGELNLSSDIDLIFAYREGGYTRGGEKELDNQSYFTRLGQRLIKAIDAMTIDGFVFRVDMRLRPYGNSGALALSFDAMEDYYQDQGRDWERYAMIKARPVAGNSADGAELMDILRPFSYRRYIDFSVIESLRKLKAMIRQEVARKGLHDNVKLGAGGIREVEFIAQSFQLVRGGRDPELQERSVLKILDLLQTRELLTPQDRNALREAYVFLRNTEHAIQALDDQQTQNLPSSPEDALRIAAALGFATQSELDVEIKRHRAEVSARFVDIVRGEDEDQEASVDPLWMTFWQSIDEREDAVDVLVEQGFADIDNVYQALQSLTQSRAFLALENQSRERIDRFMPLLFATCASSAQPSLALLRVMPLVAAIQRRTAYIVLLTENPSALAELCSLCAMSPWIAEQLAQYPVLLDELLDASTLYSPPSRQVLQEELLMTSLRLPSEDLEAHMDNLRTFKMAHVLRVAAAEVTGRLPLMKASDYLTWIAEVVVEFVVTLAREDLRRKYGDPTHSNGEVIESGFSVVGYGKMGGIELSYSSDLDMVFVYDAPMGGYTNGDKSIDNSVFFTRLGQRVLHIMTTRMSSGILYEVDMRLRPSGASGLLVSSLEAYRNYQEKSAWTWENQAIVRARVVAGDLALGTRVEQVRQGVLARSRDRATLQGEVVEMREKMRDHLLPPECRGEGASMFHLKHSRGGIVDIEFMVQFAILAHTHQHPDVARFTDNIRLLESLAKIDVIGYDECQFLCDTYRALRTAGHALALQGQSSVVPLEPYLETSQRVVAIWRRLLEQ
jgi:glutamate-ammonia-ligase adenylyltransferase